MVYKVGWSQASHVCHLGNIHVLSVDSSSGERTREKVESGREREEEEEASKRDLVIDSLV